MNPPNQHYTLGVYAGHTQWNCNYCPWDTVESEQVMLEHIAKYHCNPFVPKKPSLILLADKRGNEIK